VQLRFEIAQRSLEANITLSWMPKEQFLRLYDTHDVFVFPGLQDSAGWVVLESICRGMPVACLNLGGPKEIVTPASGILVDTTKLDTSSVAARLAEQLHALLADPERLAALSAGAITRAGEFLLHDQVERLYAQAVEHLGLVATQVRRAAA
jgi:glycosyltransferase involved in cell wall biosynthesis